MKAIFVFFFGFGAIISLAFGATLTPKYQAQVQGMSIKTEITMRYAITNVELKVRNIHMQEAEVFFHLNIPEEAFVSNFTLKVKKDEYVAIVQEKQEAENTFLQSSTTAGLVSSSEFNDGKQQVS